MNSWTTDFVIELLGNTNGGIERIRDAHDAAITATTKPLVDALEALREGATLGQRAVIDHALLQVNQTQTNKKKTVMILRL